MAIQSIGNSNLQNVQQALGDKTLTDPSAVAEDIAPLISESDNLNVNSTRRTDGTSKQVETQDAPELEDADATVSQQADLEALLALLKANQDEKQIQAAKLRIESLKGQLKSHHESTMKKVNESLEAMKKQETASIFNKIFGWLSVVVAVVAAVAMVATVGGAAAGLAIVGAAIGLATQVLNETGAMDSIVKAMAESIQDTFGCSSTTAKAWASGILGAIGIVLSVACMVGGGFASAGKGLVDVAKATQQAVKIGLTVANGVTGAATMTSSGVSTALTYDASSKEAEVTKMQKFLKQLQTALDQEEQDLKVLLEQLSDSLGAVMELLESKQDTLNNISQHIGA